MERQVFLRRKEASAYLRQKFGLERAPSTLAKLAVIGGGPPFRLLNRVPVYDPADLDGWVNSMLSARMRSTSEYKARATNQTAVACPNRNSSSVGPEAGAA